MHLLLGCRHPNVHFMIGFASGVAPRGPCLLFERAWGSVAAALRQSPLGLAAALRIAAQVASAVQYFPKFSFTLSEDGLFI